MLPEYRKALPYLHISSVLFVLHLHRRFGDLIANEKHAAYKYLVGRSEVSGLPFRTNRYLIHP